MATRSQTPRSQSRPVANSASPAWKWLFIVSLSANLILAILAARPPTLPKEPEKAAAPEPAPVAKPAAPTITRELRPYAALGTYMAENNRIPALQWTQVQFDAFIEGMRSSYEGGGYPVDEEATKLREEINAKVQAMISSKKTDPVQEYFSLLREKEGVLQTPTGLHYRVTMEGFGDKPGPESTVVVTYTARLPGGESLPVLTRARVRSAVRDLLPGLAEGVQLLAPGAKALVYVPPALSFGEGAWPNGVPKGAPIVFLLELHEVNNDTEETSP